MTGSATSPRILVPGHPAIAEGDCQVVAEAGANHNNDVQAAIDMAVSAARAGAWAIKFQLYKAESLTVPDSPKYWQDSIGTRSQFEAFKLSDHLDYDQWGPVADACRDLGIVFFATPFDLDAVDALENLGVPIYKLASADITHKPLIEAIAETGKPLMMSTGASSIDEIARAVGWSGLGPDRLVILACTLTYPTPDPDGHFARITTLRRQFEPYLIGSSDHTVGPEGGWIASALGAVLIEKHFTITPDAGEVPDHAMSVTQDQLAVLVDAAHRGAILRGRESVELIPSELPARQLARRSIVSSRPIAKGETIVGSSIDFRRPGTGIAPYEVDAVVGRKAAIDIPPNSTIEWDWIE
jgi:sialic acid synthase SpsE